MNDIRQRLLVVFQAEAKEHLARIRSILEKEGINTSGANLDEVFRRAHSLKGASRAVDLRSIESLAHPLETLFARVRERTFRLDDHAMSVIHEALDQIEEIAGSPANATSSNDRAQQKISKLLEIKAESKIGDHPSTVATVESSKVVAAAPATTAEKTVLTQTAETVRISSGIVDRLHRSVGQLTTEGLRQDLLADQLNEIGARISELSHEWGQLRGTVSGKLRKLGEKPEVAGLSRFLKLMERQLATLEKDTRSLSAFQQRSKWSLSKLSEQLHQDVRGARMIIAEHVFDNFGKMMRDLARDEGKEIQFRASGLDLEVDRLVLQALKDPLMHLLRNTLGHGIETPIERRQAGKDPTGFVSFRLEAQGNRLKAIVEDDGRGLDLQRITEVAIKKKLLTETEAAALSPEEKIRLIFQPGFSTARTITELSGRGMGLNVVTDAVAQLQGTVDVEPGNRGGSRFIVSVPLTVSAHRLLLVKCRKQTFAIPAHTIEHLHRIKGKDIISIEGKPSLRLQGVLVPLVNLAQLLQVGEPAPISTEITYSVVVIRSAERRIAVVVDVLLDEMQAVVKDLGFIAMKSGKYAGGALLGDGSVILVLNASDLFAVFQRLDRTQQRSAPVDIAEERKSTILVVDDSMTTRSLEKSILEAHGYDVVIAVDGVDALTQLRSKEINLIVSDIEMPRLDGFGLVEAIKKDAVLAKIPIILVTSLEKREDKERGLSLGADGYIVKRKFDQKELLEAVRQMV